VWVQMARKYRMVHINKAIYIGEYLENGLMKSRRKNNIKSPKGCMTRANGYLYSDINLKFRTKCALQYMIYGWFAGRSTAQLIKDANQKWLVCLCTIPARVIYTKWKFDFRGIQ